MPVAPAWSAWKKLFVSLLVFRPSRFSRPPFNAQNPRSTLIFPRSLSFTLRHGTYMPSCRVYSPLQPRNAILSASRALRVKSSAHYLVLPLNPADRSTLLTLSPKQPTKSDPLTPVFSVQLARFSSLLVTLAKITPAFPHTSEKHPGVAPPLLHKKKN